MPSFTLVLVSTNIKSKLKASHAEKAVSPINVNIVALPDQGKFVTINTWLDG